LEVFKKILLFDVLPALCHIFALTFLAAAFCGIGIPPSAEVSNAVWGEALLGTFFLLLPAAKKISLGKLITFEREVEKIKEEVIETRAQMTSFLGVYSTMLATISNTVKQTVNVYHPGIDERQKAKAAIEEVQNADAVLNVEDKVAAYVESSGGDYNFALARIRMDLERTLRENLGKRTATPDPTQMRDRFVSAGQLFRSFLSVHPDLEQLRSSFDYVLKTCNAAIHGQTIEENYAKEAIYMGLSLLDEIKGVDAGQAE
jgi:hypothetical protein